MPPVRGCASSSPFSAPALPCTSAQRGRHAARNLFLVGTKRPALGVANSCRPPPPRWSNRPQRPQPRWPDLALISDEGAPAPKPNFGQLIGWAASLQNGGLGLRPLRLRPERPEAGRLPATRAGSFSQSEQGRDGSGRKSTSTIVCGAPPPKRIARKLRWAQRVGRTAP